MQECLRLGGPVMSCAESNRAGEKEQFQLYTRYQLLFSRSGVSYWREGLAVQWRDMRSVSCSTRLISTSLEMAGGQGADRGVDIFVGLAPVLMRRAYSQLRPWNSIVGGQCPDAWCRTRVIGPFCFGRWRCSFAKRAGVYARACWDSRLTRDATTKS